MNRNQKTDLVKTLRSTFEDSASVVVVHCVGLTVAESTDLRNKMRNDNCYFKVTKNKITRLALKDTKYQHMDEMFSGPTAIGSSKDEAKLELRYQFLAEKRAYLDLMVRQNGLNRKQANTRINLYN